MFMMILKFNLFADDDDDDDVTMCIIELVDYVRLKIFFFKFSINNNFV